MSATHNVSSYNQLGHNLATVFAGDRKQPGVGGGGNELNTNRSQSGDTGPGTRLLSPELLSTGHRVSPGCLLRLMDRQAKFDDVWNGE